MSEFTVSNPLELNALLLALLEAKLPSQPRDMLVAASPLVAELAKRVADAHALDADLSVSWRVLDSKHAHWDAVISRAAHDADWLRKCDREQRRRYVRGLAAPFRIADVTFEALVARIEYIANTRSYFDLWLRAEQPHHGGILVVREMADGSMVVLDQAKKEVVNVTNAFDLWDWLRDRNYRHIGRYVDTAQP